MSQHQVMPRCGSFLSKNRSTVLLLSTAGLTIAMMVTRVIFAINANENIADEQPVCSSTGPSTFSKASAAEVSMATASAVIFAANTLFSTIYRTYASVDSWLFASSLSAEQLYVFSRFVKHNNMDGCVVIVANDQHQQQLQKHLDGKAENLSLIPLYQRPQRVINDDTSDYAIGLNQSQLPRDTVIIKPTITDKLCRGLSMLPLVFTGSLRLFYAFYAYNQLATFHGVGYALAAIQAPLQFFFRSSDTALCAIKFKDQLASQPLIGLCKLFIIAGLTYAAMPYGLYFSQTLLTGTIRFFNHQLDNHHACHALAASDVFLWLGSITFALPALEAILNFLSAPLKNLQRWSHDITLLGVVLLASLGISDAFFSAYYYPQDLLGDYLTEAPSAYRQYLSLLYTVIYSLYFIPGNIGNMADIKQSLFGDDNQLSCAFFRNAAVSSGHQHGDDPPDSRSQLLPA